jgi:hypothetical protein
MESLGLLLHIAKGCVVVKVTCTHLHTFHSILIEFQFPREVMGLLLHIEPCVVVAGSPIHLSINIHSPLELMVILAA